MEAEPNITQDMEKLEKPSNQDRVRMIVIGVIAVIVLAALITAAVLLLLPQNANFAGQLRDVFIIFMALVMLVIGIALVILVTQLAILTNLLQNEIKPILKTTNDTVNTLHGTVVFLSDNISEPVIKLNEYLAAVKRIFELIRPSRRH